MRLQDKVAFVSGVGARMGSAIASLFAQEGADVALMARKAEVVEQVASNIETQMKRKAIALQGDATSVDDIGRAVAECQEKLGTPDIFITLPGGGFRHENDLDVMDQPFFEMMFQNHIMSVFHGVRSVIPLMKAHGSGSIIMIAASEVVMQDGNVAYHVMKRGVIAMTRSLARELHPFNIRVNCIAPGLIRQPFEFGEVNPPEQKLNRRGQAEDIAYAALYLASPESAWVTGQTFTIDGGKDMLAGHERQFD